jgi:hypothetical protein
MKPQIAEVRQSFTGKWLVVIDTYNRTGDRCAFSTESAAVFASSDEAYAGGARAVAAVEKTGMFPNMCESF